MQASYDRRCLLPCRGLGFVTESHRCCGSRGFERLIPSPLQGACNGGTKKRKTVIRKMKRRGWAGRKHEKRPRRGRAARCERRRRAESASNNDNEVIVDNRTRLLWCNGRLVIKVRPVELKKCPALFGSKLRRGFGKAIRAKRLRVQGALGL